MTIPDIKTRILSILLRIYFILLPFHILPTPYIFFNKIRYADLFFVLILTFWIAGVLKKKYTLLDSNAILVLSMILISNFFSFFYSVDRNKSLLDFLGLIYLIAIFIVFASLLREESFMMITINAIANTTFFISAIGIIFFVLYCLKINFPFDNMVRFDPVKTHVAPFVRISSVCGSSEMFITFSQLGLACTIIEFFSINKNKTSNYITKIVVILSALLLAWARALAGVFLMLGLILNRIKFKKSILLRNITMILFLIIFFAAFITSIWMIYPIKIKRNSYDHEISMIINTAPDLRSVNRHAAIKMFKERPLFGFGQGMFTYNVSRYVNKEKAKKTLTLILSQLEPDKFVLDPHSTFFGALAETGLFGLFTMLFLFIYILFSNRVTLFSRQITPAWCFLSCFLGYLSTALFSDIFAFRHLWVTMALLMAVRNNIFSSNEK